MGQSKPTEKSLVKEHRRMSRDGLTKRLHRLQRSLPDRESAREIELQAVLQELEIYQVELEMQNRELRDSRQVIEESQDRYVNLYDFAPMGYVTLTDQGLIREINLTAAGMMGIERQWLIERSLFPWILGTDLSVFREHLRKCNRSEETTVSVLHFMRRDKQVFPAEISSVRFSDPATHAPLFRTTITDITERKRMEDSLREAVGKLEEERHLREQFVSTLTHDLRTPLTAAKMGAQLLGKKNNEPSVVSKHSGQILKSIDRIDHMIQDLLDANRIGAGEMLPMEFAEFDLRSLAKNTLDELAAVHGDRFVLFAQESIRGSWSKSGLRRVIENLVGNAIKYGASQEPVSVSLVSDANDHVTLTVHNSGNPISPEDQATLFQQFRRTADAEKGRQQGWGLGLTLVRGIVEAHGGKITVESNIREGTSFRAVLPLNSHAA